MTTHRYSLDELKVAAQGKWVEILSTLGGIPVEILDGKHHACPWCGGVDRFRLIDEQAGAIYCNVCHNRKNGDGLAALQRACGWTFPEACVEVAGYLGVQPSENGQQTNKGKTSLLDAVDWLDRSLIDPLLKIWCSAKRGVTPEAAQAFRAAACRWSRRKYRCIAFPGRRIDGDRADLAALLLYRVEGIEFPGSKKVGTRKTHLVKASRESWLYPGSLTDLRAAKLIVKCEGLPDALALHAAGLPAGWMAITNACGAASAHRNKLDFSFAVGKRIVIIGDADAPGQAGVKRFAVAFAQAGAAEARVVQLPYPITEDHGKDLRDWLNEGHTMADFLALVEAAPTITTEQVDEWAAETQRKRIRSTSGLPEIVIGEDEPRVIDEAIGALRTVASLFQRALKLVQVIRDCEPPKGIARPRGSPRIAPLKLARLRELLAGAATWLIPTDEEPRPCHPPDWAVKGVDARGEWHGIRRLEAVVEVPVLRADGSVLQTPGYDNGTGLMFEAEATFFQIPERPTQADAHRARDDLLEIVEDFPFASDAHRAAWVAAAITPLARYAFHGPAPLFLVDANVRGCGKSLLTDLIATLASGRDMARMALPRDDDELRKRITALAVAGEPLILIDNIAGTLGSPSLDAALTATTWSDRLLGRSEMASNVPLFATWFATGNNVMLGADTARRVVHVRLESDRENPEERSDFRHPDLLAWVRRERPRLVSAAITVLAGYWAAGRPSMGLTPWGSFEAWSDLVRQAVVWSGLGDPGATRTDLVTQSDQEVIALRQLVDSLECADPKGLGLTVAQMLDLLADHPEDFQPLRAALFELAPPRDGKTLNPRSVGMKFHHLRRRVVAGRFLDNKLSREGALWFARSAENCGTNATSGTNPVRCADAGARAHAQVLLETAGNSPSSPASPAAYKHVDVEECPTHDGYVNRNCRTCGKNLGCAKQVP